MTSLPVPAHMPAPAPVRRRGSVVAVRNANAEALGRPRRLAMARFALIGMLFLTLIGVQPFTESVMTAESQSNVMRQLAYFALLIILATGSEIFANVKRLVSIPAALLVLLGYCLLSVTWAVDPGVAIRRLGLTILVAWVIFRVVSELGYPTTVRLLRRFLIFMLFVNFAVVAFTRFGIHGYLAGDDPGIIGDWRGILPHKNTAGAVCAFTILLFLLDRRSIPRFQVIGVVAAAAIFLFFSRAKTSEGFVVIALACGAIIRPYSATYRSLTLLSGGLVLIVAAQILAIYSNTALGMLDDPTSFTGRGQIWPLLLQYAGDHLMTGAGFQSFWQIGPASPIWQYTNGWVARGAGHGHNGYLDLLVTIGLPGLLLAIVVLVIWPLARLLFSTSLPKARRSLLVAMIVFAAGHNLTESSLLNADAVVEVFLLITIALIYQQSNLSDGRHQHLRRRMWRMVRRVSLRGPRAPRHPAPARRPAHP